MVIGHWKLVIPLLCGWCKVHESFSLLRTKREFCPGTFLAKTLSTKQNPLSLRHSVGLQLVGRSGLTRISLLAARWGFENRTPPNWRLLACLNRQTLSARKPSASKPVRPYGRWCVPMTYRMLHYQDAGVKFHNFFWANRRTAANMSDRTETDRKGGLSGYSIKVECPLSLLRTFRLPRLYCQNHVFSGLIPILRFLC
ncbi:hypothetical protein Pr1d_45140 [Bythopirellula goksoeyrii]|uniref:Uncharacterized protein n=1 Tax=Bythopirellula goksoeyrii TaxID=1400387 RepID=A0A5B9QTC3_9BACT|nr:hypothetical protein Pr1d_45140 [Bythopirellula goksoeyrii]